MLKDITMKLLKELPEDATEVDIENIAYKIININNEYEKQK